MIPVSTRQYIQHTDDDGITWHFKPKYGEIEIEFLQIVESTKSQGIIASAEVSDSFIDKIVLGWNDPQKRIVDYPADKRPSKLFSQDEKAELLSMWHNCNRLSQEEKKS